MARTWSAQPGPAAWPVAVPENVDDVHLVKASGAVELPHHTRRSGPPLSYDLDSPIDRARVYEQVLREGTDDDVRFCVQVDELLARWDQPVLPPQVRKGWVRWFREHRGLELARHRLNCGGNRRLNRALYVIAITQTRHEPRAVDYLARKRAAGNTGREAHPLPETPTLRRHLPHHARRRVRLDT